MSLSDLCTNYISTAKLKDETERNIIEFAEAPWGLGMGSSIEVPPLYPVQKFIFKCFYNIPLNGTEHNIIIKDKFNEKERFRFTELEYLQFLRDEGRINIKEVTGNLADSRLNLLLVIGRRGCKTSSIAVIVGYETYKLLKRVCPQQYYRIMPDDEIRISCIATNQEQAAELFHRITGHLERSDYFKKYRNKPTLSFMQLSTQRDIEEYGPNQRPSLRIVASPSSGRGLRGHNNIIAILDEMAYFFEEDNSVDRSDATIFDAVTPSVAKFVSPEGEPHGRVIAISSPAAKTGKFFELYERSFEPDCNDLLMIQAPTWEVDYTLSSKMLRSKYADNPFGYDAEYGAQFTDRRRSWISNEQVLRMNIIPNLKFKSLSYERIPHFMGIDIGLKNDGTAIAIGHIVRLEQGGGPKDFIELDCLDARYSSDEGKEYFRPDEMAEWIASYAKKFFILKGMMDQEYGYAIMPALVDLGCPQITATHFTRELNSEVYQNLMAKLLDGSLRIPDGDEREYEGKRTKDIPLVCELLKLQATTHSKYLISVEAPEGKDRHDDMSDAFTRMVYLATEHLKSSGNIISSNVTTTAGGHTNISYKRYLRRQKGNVGFTHRPSTSLMASMSAGRFSMNSFGNSFTGRR